MTGLSVYAPSNSTQPQTRAVLSFTAKLVSPEGILLGEMAGPDPDNLKHPDLDAEQ